MDKLKKISYQQNANKNNAINMLKNKNKVRLNNDFKFNIKVG